MTTAANSSAVETALAYERAIIGAALADPDDAERILDMGVAPETFCDPQHAAIWAALMASEHKVLLEVQDLLRADEHPAANTLHLLVDAACMSQAIDWHVAKVKDAARRRELHRLGVEITEKASEGEIETILASCRERLDQIDKAVAPKDDGRSLADFARMEIDHAETLLGRRYLCRGGTMLFVGPSGIGKSSASCQQDMLWSLGRDAFGIRPARPLRILAFQAENDDGDQHEMAAGVARGLRLTDADLETVAMNTRYLTRFETGQAFLAMMAREVDRWRPDLVRLDPLNAYIGDDAKEPKAIAMFCRSGINPILHRYRCGCVVAHHTPKTNFRDTTGWTALDWAYAGAGGADLTNWARAVLVVDPVNLIEGVFKFIGAKRGARMDWRNEADESEIERFFCYAREPGVIYWREPDQSEVTSARRSNPKATRTPDEILEYIPADGELTGKATLLEHVQRKLNIGQKKSEAFLKSLIERGLVHEHREKRKNKRDAIFIGRHAPKTEVQS